MAMMTPFFLAGLALLAVPWLIHRIRRPERETIRFSSLMFVPNIPKKVIERRKIQDVLLMLLRMFALALLALIFSRPYFTEQEGAVVVAENAQTRHLILIDVSASMSTTQLQEAKRIAKQIIGDIPQSEEVGVTLFHSTPQMLTPIGPKDGSALASLGTIIGTHHETNYPVALVEAEDQLLSDHQKPPPMIVHMISDFRRNGIPELAGGWRLSGLISFKSYLVSPSDQDNFSITDVGVRQVGETQMVAGKIKNWSLKDHARVAVRLFLDNKMIEEKYLAVNAGNASRVEFQLAQSGNFSGWLEIDRDGADIDNQRYFVWRPPRKPKVLLVTDIHPQTQYPASQFVEMALVRDWSLKKSTFPSLLADMDGFKPDLLLISSLDGLRDESGEFLLEWAGNGGKVLLTLGQVPPDAPLNKALLQPLGLTSEGPRYEQFLEQRYAMLTDINFNHPAFLSFSNAQFNDFSPIHFYNFHGLTITGEGPGTLARFHGEASLPAMVEVGIGKGRVLVWAFSPQLEWTNLPKHIKFVPLLSETVKYLNGREKEAVNHLVGNVYDPSRWDGAQAVQLADGSQQDHIQPFPLTSPGLISLNIKGRWQVTDAVNINPLEQDPSSISPEELALKLTSGSNENNGLQATATAAASRDKKVEYGYVFLMFLVIGLLIETWAQEYMTRRKTPDLQAS